MQATRPDTFAAALNDSPAGLLAWLTEKLVEWSDVPEDDPPALEQRISRDRILTEAMLYWVTQTIALVVPAVLRGSRHTRADPARGGAGRRAHPAARARLPRVARPPRFYRDLRVFERLDEGGHFAVAEVPEAMAARTRSFARTSACCVRPDENCQAARPRRSRSGWMSASRPRKSR